MYSQHMSISRSQSGAALVVGLILLVALTLLALTSVNTASLDLIMAGNTQYQQKAFNASEAGIEQAWQLNDQFQTDPAAQPAAVSGTVAGTDDDYEYAVRVQYNGVPKDPPPGSRTSIATYDAIYFEITSEGSSGRGSAATHMQRVYTPVPATTDSGGCGSGGGASGVSNTLTNTTMTTAEGC